MRKMTVGGRGAAPQLLSPLLSTLDALWHSGWCSELDSYFDTESLLVGWVLEPPPVSSWSFLEEELVVDVFFFGGLAAAATLATSFCFCCIQYNFI